MNPQDRSRRLYLTDAEVDEAWVVMRASYDDQATQAGPEPAARRGRHRRPSRITRPWWLRVPDWWPTRLLAQITDLRDGVAMDHNAMQLMTLSRPWYPGSDGTHG